MCINNCEKEKMGKFMGLAELLGENWFDKVNGRRTWGRILMKCSGSTVWFSFIIIIISLMLNQFPNH